MTKEIIPTILVKSFSDAKEKIRQVENYVNWIQLDIMDGIFVNNETWPYVDGGNIIDLKKLRPRAKIEVHLMVNKPEDVIKDWISIADRIIFHFESKIKNRELGIRELIKKVHKRKKEIGMAINPETHLAVAMPFLKDLDLVLFLAVQPGWGGQEFKEWTLDKIKFLRNVWPNGNIEIDGGVNNENINKIIDAGANLICVGTYIFKSQNIEQTINNLKNSINL